MDIAAVTGYALGLLGLLSTLYYGRRGRETERAFVRYVELDREVETLRKDRASHGAAVRQLELLKAEVFRLRSSRPASAEALRLAAAADERSRRKAATEKPLRRFTFAAKGDLTDAVSDLADRYFVQTGEVGIVDPIRYLENANLTVIGVEGEAWPTVLLDHPDWKLVPKPPRSDWSSHAIIEWCRKAADVARLPRAMTYSSSAELNGECVFIDVYSSTDLVHRLGLLATLENHRPVPMAHLFQGTPKEVAAEYRSWIAENRAPI